MTPDILTLRGKEAARDQVIAANAVVSKHRTLDFVHTRIEDADPEMVVAAVDGIFVNAAQPCRTIAACAEIKARDMSLAQLERWGWEWLVTHQKMEDLRMACRLFRCRGVGVLYLKPDRLVLTRHICDHLGRWLVPYRTANTTTQATCNGGTATRENGFIGMRGSRYYEVTQSLLAVVETQQVLF